MTRRTPLLVAVAGLAAGLLLGGCNVNAGDKAVSDFEDWWDGHAVEGVELTSTNANNDLPFTGSGEVWLMPDDSVDVEALVDDLCGYHPDKTTALHLDSARAPESIEAAETSTERDVEVEIDCSDRSLTLGRWEALLVTDGLETASVNSDDLVADFESGAQLRAAVPGLRRLGLDELHLSAGEFNTPGVLSVDDEGVSDDVRALVDAALASDVPLISVDASEHHRSGVELEVIVDGDQPDVDELEQVLRETNPDAASLVSVTPKRN